MVIIMQDTINYIVKKNPNKLERFERIGVPQHKEIDNIKYIIFND